MKDRLTHAARKPVSIAGDVDVTELLATYLQQHLATIRAFYRSHRRMPSYGELTAVVGFRSKNAAYKLAARLIDGGWLEKDEAGKIVPGRLFSAVPVLGTVTAGFPSP